MLATPVTAQYILRCDISFLLSIYRAGLTRLAFNLHRAAPSSPIDDLRYLGGATTYLGRERLARCGLEAARVNLLYGWRVNSIFSRPKLTGR